MKKRVFVVMFVGIVLLGIILFMRYSMPHAPINSAQNSGVTDTLLTNATVTIPEIDPVTTIKLTGVTTNFSPFTDAPDSADSSVTLIGDAIGTIQTIYTILAINTGGSGTFFYLTAFEKLPSGYIAEGFEPLGDRISFQSISFTPPNMVTVSYLTHGSDQTMVESPDQKVTQSYLYAEGSFQEIE